MMMANINVVLIHVCVAALVMCIFDHLIIADPSLYALGIEYILTVHYHHGNTPEVCGPHLFVKHILEKQDISMHMLCNVTHFLTRNHFMDSLCIMYLRTLESL